MDIRDTIKATNTAIATVDLVKDYGSGNNTVHALRGVNVAFEKGKFTAIMGPSGFRQIHVDAQRWQDWIVQPAAHHIQWRRSDAHERQPAYVAAPPRHRIHLPKLQPAADVHRRTEHSHAIDLGWSETRPTVVASAGGNAWP